MRKKGGGRGGGGGRGEGGGGGNGMEKYRKLLSRMWSISLTKRVYPGK